MGKGVRMIDIRMRWNKEDCWINIKGHAQYAPLGKDIVCASISTLYENLIDSLESLSGCFIEDYDDIEETRIHISMVDLAAVVLINSFRLGCMNISEQYKDNVRYRDVQTHIQ